MTGRDFLLLIAAELRKPSQLDFFSFVPCFCVSVFGLIWRKVPVNWLPHCPPNNKGDGEAAREQGLEYLCTANLCPPPTTSHCTAPPQTERWRADVSVDPSHASSVAHGWWFQHFGSWASPVREVRHQRHLWTSCEVTKHHARSHKHHRKAKPQLYDVLRAACSELQHLSQLCRASLSTYLCLHHCCSLPTGRSGLTAPLFFCVPAVMAGQQ